MQRTPMATQTSGILGRSMLLRVSSVTTTLHVFFAYLYVAITFNPNGVADNMKKYKVVARLLKRSEIDGRSDDNEETVRVRLQVYAEQTEPLLKVYRSRGLLVDVDGLGEIEEVSERVFAALEAHREGKASELIEP